MDSCSAGSTAIYSVRYTIDYGTLKEGDVVTVEIPKEVAEKASSSVDPTHFSSVKDNGDGTWSMTLVPNAATALAGSFNIFTTKTDVKEETSTPVTVGGSSKDLVVIPRETSDGGSFSVIMKDVLDDEVNYGGYDYSEGPNAH